MIAVLAGGVGAARFLRGLTRIVDPAEVTVVVNTADDTVLHGLYVSPDLDTVTYTLAGAENPATGWGLAGETFAAMDALDRYGAPTWFRLGDRDLATHLYRTGRLARGARLSEVTAEVAAAWGLQVELLPMTDDMVRTWVELLDGTEIEFQEYFVRLRHDVPVRKVRFAGADGALPAPGVLEALVGAETIVVAPSNPIVSIGPILAVPGVADVLTSRRERVVAISPIVAGAALKGPAGRLLVELGGESSATGVARLLADRIGTLVVDDADRSCAEEIEAMGVRCIATATVMETPDVAAKLARVVLDASRPA